ncbi:MAG: hypothetical protein LBE21_02090, partial [Pseudomonadales bacterium]|nr:hypothetical protein [Pseudomonadales bacterium]
MNKSQQIFTMSTLLASLWLPASLALADTIEVAINGEDQLSLNYQLDEPVSAFEFAVNNDTLNGTREQYWQVEEGFVLSDGKITAQDQGSFDQFSISLAPFYARLDRQYEHYTKLADGAYVIYFPYFPGASMQDLRVIFTRQDGRQYSLDAAELNGTYLFETNGTNESMRSRFMSYVDGQAQEIAEVRAIV